MTDVSHFNDALAEFAALPGAPTAHAVFIKSVNRANQLRMLRDVGAICSRYGTDSRQIARRLDIDQEAVEDALGGRTDLTLTELRLLFGASDVIVDYRVRPARSAVSTWWDRHVSGRVTEPEQESQWGDVVTLMRNENGWS